MLPCDELLNPLATYTQRVERLRRMRDNRVPLAADSFGRGN